MNSVIRDEVEKAMDTLRELRDQEGMPGHLRREAQRTLDLFHLFASYFMKAEEKYFGERVRNIDLEVEAEVVLGKIARN